MPNQYTRPSRRTTMPLAGSIKHSEVRLSFESVLAAFLAVRLIGQASPLRPTMSAIARRALVLYCQGLEAMSPEELACEAHAVARASKALQPLEAGALQEALEGLEAVPTGQPLPSLRKLVYGPSGGLDVAALNAALASHLQTIHPRRFANG